MKLTKPVIARLCPPEGKSDVVFWDDELPGFGVRVTNTGKVFLLQYRLGMRQRRLTLGKTGIVDLDAARRRAKAALAEVARGIDPQAARDEAKMPKPQDLTLLGLVSRYLPVAERKLKASTYAGLELHLTKHWQPLHGLAAASIERRHVAARLNELGQGRTGIGANRSRAALSSLFTWAIGEGLVDVNPVTGTNRPGEEVSRDRVLSDAELRAIWLNVGEGHYGAIVKLLMLTGQRRDEIGAMRWSELDLDKALWTIPKERTKNGLEHDVPLSEAAVMILEALQGEALQGRDLIFGQGEGGFSGWSKAKERLDKHLTAAVIASASAATAVTGMPPWRLHDLRRTMATRMHDMGVQPHIVEAVLNHVSGHKAGVAGVYNKATYMVDKKRALSMWADHIMSLVQDRQGKVVALRVPG
jgi:integrase